MINGSLPLSDFIIPHIIEGLRTYVYKSSHRSEKLFCFDLICSKLLWGCFLEHFLLYYCALLSLLTEILVVSTLYFWRGIYAANLQRFRRHCFFGNHWLKDKRQRTALFNALLGSATHSSSTVCHAGDLNWYLALIWFDVTRRYISQCFICSRRFWNHFTDLEEMEGLVGMGWKSELGI